MRETKTFASLVGTLALVAVVAAPAFTASSPPIEFPSQMVGYGFWLSWAKADVFDAVLSK